MAGIQDMIANSGTLIGGSSFDAVAMLEGAKAKRNLIIGGVVAAILIAAGVTYALYKRSKAKEAKEGRKKNPSYGARKARRVKARKAKKANPVPVARVKRRRRGAKRALHPAFVANIKRKTTKTEVKEAA